MSGEFIIISVFGESNGYNLNINYSSLLVNNQALLFVILIFAYYNKNRGNIQHEFRINCLWIKMFLILEKYGK